MTVPREDVSVAKQEVTLEQMLHNGVYKIQHVLAHGRWGNVYLASHVALSVSLVIKQFHTAQELPARVRMELDALLRDSQRSDLIPNTPTFSHMAVTLPLTDNVDTNASNNTCFEEFLREALFLARVQHPALPMLYDYFFEHGSWYLVMDYIPAVTLDTYLKSKRSLPPLEALDYALQLCNVLEYLHTRTPAIIFHALEPAHILLLPDHTIVLIDFGHAHYEKERTSLHHLNAVSLSKEVVNKEVTQSELSTPVEVQEFYDPRSDLYDLGLLLYKMLAGREERASSEADESLIPLHIVHPEISNVLSGMVKLATCNDPLQRFQSAHTFFLALERTFAIEERNLLDLQSSDHGQVARASEVTEHGDVIDWPATKEPFSPDLEYRLQLRTHFWQSRPEQLQQKRRKKTSQYLLPPDESLKKRSSPVLPVLEPAVAGARTESARIIMPEASDTPPTPQTSQHTPHVGTLSQRAVQHIVQTCFIIALILFLILVSLLLYTRSQRPGIPNAPAWPSKALHNKSSIDTVISHDSWQVLPSLPSPEADNAAVYDIVGGRPYIYMNGGYRESADGTGQDNTKYDHSLYRYDIQAAHWEVVSDHFPGLVNNAAAVDEHGTLFFTTGYSSDSYNIVSTLWQYQPEQNTTQQIQPPAQITPGFGSALIADQQGHLFLSQGFLKSGDPHATAGNGWYRYDISNGQWHTLANMPIGLGYVTLTRDSSGGILLLGGSTDAGQQMQSAKIYRYDSAHDSWSLEDIILPHPISGEAACSPYADALVLVGGVDAGLQFGVTSAQIIDLRTLHSTALPEFPVGGSALGTAACDNAGHLFFVRGTSNLKLATRDFWLLTVQALPKQATPTVVPTVTVVNSRVS